MNPPLIWLVWTLNGLLAIIYTLADNLAVLLILPPLIWLAITARKEHLPWVAATGGLCLLTGFLVPAPVPVILALMAWAGAIGVRLDMFNPTALRWRVNGGLALYALAALGFAAYAAYTSRLDPHAWSSVVVGGDADQVIAQGRSFLNTIAVWGLWIILPMGYLGLILQGIFVHPPTPGTPADMIHTVRARGRER